MQDQRGKQITIWERDGRFLILTLISTLRKNICKTWFCKLINSVTIKISPLILEIYIFHYIKSLHLGLYIYTHIKFSMIEIASL